MRAGWLPSVTDWIPEQRGFLLVCRALRQATLVFVMYELLHRWNPPVKQAVYWYLAYVNIWDLVKKNPLWAGVCKQRLKRATNKWWNWKSHLEKFLFLFRWVPDCEAHYFLDGCFTISPWDAHHVLASTPCKSFGRDDSTTQRLS